MTPSTKRRFRFLFLVFLYFAGGLGLATVSKYLLPDEAHVSIGAKDKVKAMEMERHTLAPRLREDCSTAAASEGWGLEKAVAQRKKKM